MHMLPSQGGDTVEPTPSLVSYVQTPLRRVDYEDGGGGGNLPRERSGQHDLSLVIGVNSRVQSVLGQRFSADQTSVRLLNLLPGTSVPFLAKSHFSKNPASKSIELWLTHPCPTLVSDLFFILHHPTRDIQSPWPAFIKNLARLVWPESL